MIDISYLVLGLLQNNTFLLKDENSGELAVIDPSIGCDELFDAIDSNGGKLKYILLTHGHFDHVGGVKSLKDRYCDAKICISKDEMKLLKDDSLNGAKLHHLKFDDFDVDVELSDGDIVVLGNDEIKFITTPGHTAGSGCYILNNHIFSGDTLFCQSIGRTDFPTSNHSDMLKSLRKLKNLEGEYAVYPGHDVFTTLDSERKYNPYMKQV